MASEDSPLDVPDAFHTLVTKARGGLPVPLRAEQVDLPSRCCNVDPMPFLPVEMQTLLHQPAALFDF